MEQKNSIKSVMPSKAEVVVDADMPLHDEFSWLHADIKQDVHAEFCALVKDVASGCKTILELLHADSVERDANKRPILSPQKSEYLMLMAVRTVEMLGNSSDRRIDLMNRVAAEAQRAPSTSNREGSPA
ncbi:hypothetical protein [Massilia antarctica]|uniref:hypothetical protein n=1 Tax=Massilia antarctica TaxID=2765360 RepID=UPI00226DCECF|nr:hypothetical protein [Massilia sp. H27-R4]MCY0913225.1 hypothetical protein [Massilia sp. H27-R4]